MHDGCAQRVDIPKYASNRLHAAHVLYKSAVNSSIFIHKIVCELCFSMHLVFYELARKEVLLYCVHLCESAVQWTEVWLFECEICAIAG